MSRSQFLFRLQQLDTGIDNAQNRIQEINRLLLDRTNLDEALKIHQELESNHASNLKALKIAEGDVALQNAKVEQNQRKLYGGSITNPKELEDLQLESISLAKYLHVLEERQLEAMFASDRSQSELDSAAAKLDKITRNMEAERILLNEEKSNLEADITALHEKKKRLLEKEALSDLSIYQTLRESASGIAVTLMIDSSCASCGASIPSAIEQEAKAPAKLAFCPTCKRILHPG
ncbi:MAG: hypothetical protein DRI65_00175 [Chloroflexota bacterium]|nr:MAG: hypothetical protein DRI65_00175 [Chloroflexota bacterium]